MIDLWFWPTPNGLKVSILLEEIAMPYRIVPVNIGRGEQFRPEVLKISPHNRMPAIVDHDPPGGGPPISIFESGAILLYLAEKSGKLVPADLRGRYEVTQWLMWQMAGLGPMLGQANYFRHYAAEKIPHAIERYTKEANRLFGVMDTRLSDRAFLAGEYSIADIACWPWVGGYERAGQRLEDFPHLKSWYERIGSRSAVQKGAAAGKDLQAAQPAVDDEAKKHLFGQTAKR